MSAYEGDDDEHQCAAVVGSAETSYMSFAQSIFSICFSTSQLELVKARSARPRVAGQPFSRASIAHENSPPVFL
jgi:dTDP-4-dehydrorhamnose reductase